MKAQEAIINARIGVKLRELRKFRQLTRVEVARLAGVSHQQLQKYDSGINRISAAKLEVLSKAMNVSMTNFYE